MNDAADERAWATIAAQVAKRNREAIVLDEPTSDELRQLVEQLRAHRPDLFEEEDPEAEQR